VDRATPKKGKWVPLYKARYLEDCKLLFEAAGFKMLSSQKEHQL